jgi:hypothetical protein
MIGVLRKSRGWCRTPRRDGIDHGDSSAVSASLRTCTALRVPEHPETRHEIFKAPAIHAVVFSLVRKVW